MPWPIPAALVTPRGPLLAGGIDVERGLQHQPLQLTALVPDHLLPLPVVEAPGLVRRPGRQPRELLRRGGQRRRYLPLQRGLAPVVEDLPHRHREPRRHRRASCACRERFLAILPETPPEPAQPVMEPPPGHVRNSSSAPCLNSANHYQQCQEYPVIPQTLPVRDSSTRN